MARLYWAYNPQTCQPDVFCVVVAGIYLHDFDLKQIFNCRFDFWLVAWSHFESVFVLLHNPSSFSVRIGRRTKSGSAGSKLTTVDLLNFFNRRCCGYNLVSIQQIINI